MDFENFSWEVRPDGKVHFFAKDRGDCHWTLHPGTNSQAFDLHETWVDSEGMRVHKTLFMIKVEDLTKLANEIGPALVSGLLQQIRPLNLRWVRRRKIAVLRDLASTDAELAAITYKNRRKRLQVNLARLQEALDGAVWPDDLLRMPDGSFSLMAIRRWGRRRIGVGWKVTDPDGVVHLFWAPTEDLLWWGEQMEELLKEVAGQYLIPPTEYHRYLAS